MPIDEAKIGELIGTVAGLARSFDIMQKSQQENRSEVISIFKEMRDDVKDLAETSAASASKLADAMSQHIKDDNSIHAQVLGIASWRMGDNGNNGAAARVDEMWDNQNKATGILSASRLLGGALWAVLAVAIGYIIPHKT